MHVCVSLYIIIVGALTGVSCVFFFFFQAEDGIRDLVRSRGLGDVYKRQVPYEHIDTILITVDTDLSRKAFYTEVVDSLSWVRFQDSLDVEAVSYTHLTLPTSDLV